jgi:membrane-bound serine protease (ClpP class)
MLTLTDPNLIYIALVLGLWVGVTAVYLPGSFIPELIAVALLGMTVYALTLVSTNWVAVIILLVGVLLFIVMPFVKRQLALLAMGGLVMQAIGAFFLFDTMSVSPVLILLTVGISLLYHQYLLLPVLEKVKSQPVFSPENILIGAHGRVVSAINPVGTVNVQGELWTAQSDELLTPGTEIVVVDRDGLQIYVEPVKSKGLPHNESFS